MKFYCSKLALLGLLFLGSISFGMDLSVLTAEFGKIQTYPKSTPLQNGQKMMWDSSSDEETDIQSFLPERYFRLRYTPANPHLQNLHRLMDDLFLKIAQTPTGIRIFTEATNSHPEIASWIFGVSLDLVKSLPTFQTTIANWPDTWLHGTSEKRRFDFVLYEGELTKVQGWTTKEGLTTFFLRPQDITEENLLRLYIHEFVMYVQGNPLGNSKIMNPDLYFLNRPLMQQAIKLAKAYKIENQILKELGIETTDLQVSCSKNISIALQSIIPLADSFRLEEQSFYLHSYQLLSDDYTNVPSLQDLKPELGIEVLERNPELCATAMQFRFDNIIDGIGPRGPRPNIGNGTGLTTKVQISSQLAKDIKKIEVIKPADIKIEGDKKLLPKESR